MRLIASPASPFARKVRVLIEEKNVMDMVEVVEMSPLENPPELLEKNPLGKVPCLILENGEALYDSRVICDYLDQVLGAPTLLPAAGEERWSCLRREALGDGIMDAAVAIAMMLGRPEEERSPFWLARWRTVIDRGLSAAEREVEELHRVHDLGGISIACALAYLVFRRPEIDWPTAYPDLARWAAEMQARPSFKATEPR